MEAGVAAIPGDFRFEIGDIRWRLRDEEIWSVGL
jgi:hypothetical protein